MYHDKNQGWWCLKCYKERYTGAPELEDSYDDEESKSLDSNSVPLSYKFTFSYHGPQWFQAPKNLAKNQIVSENSLKSLHVRFWANEFESDLKIFKNKMADKKWLPNIDKNCAIIVKIYIQGFFGSRNLILVAKLSKTKWPEQNGSRILEKKLLYHRKNLHSRVFRVKNSNFSVKLVKNKMSDTKWLPNFEKNCAITVKNLFIGFWVK